MSVALSVPSSLTVTGVLTNSSLASSLVRVNANGALSTTTLQSNLALSVGGTLSLSTSLTSINGVASAAGQNLVLSTASFGAAITVTSATGAVAFAAAASGTSLTLSSLTSGRVTFATTAGLLTDSAALTYNSGTGALTATTFVGAVTSNTITSAAGQNLVLATGTFGTAATFTSATGAFTLGQGAVSFTGATTITGGAGNMVVTAGTGASRTLSLQSTTSGSTATTALLIDASQNTLHSGMVGIGTGVTAPIAALQVIDTGTSNPRGIVHDQYNNGTNSSQFNARKARGTFGTPLTIVTGDVVARFIGWGHDGTQFIETGNVRFTSSGTIGTNQVPSQFEVWTSTNASPSVLTQRLVIDSAGLSTFTGAMSVSGHTTFEGVTSTGATGTGNLVYSITPTLTGSPVIGGATFSSSAVTSLNSITAASATDLTLASGAGTGAAVTLSNGANGAATITAAGSGNVTLSSTTGNVTTARPLIVTNSTVSTSTTTGAFQVAGGVGIAGAIFGLTASFSGIVTINGARIVADNGNNSVNIGTGAGSATDQHNVNIGYQAGALLTGLNDSVFVGYQAGANTVFGANDNTGIGLGALQLNTTSGYNTACGNFALNGQTNSGGTDGGNSAFGDASGVLFNGTESCFMGRYSARYLTSGQRNVLIGNAVANGTNVPTALNNAVYIGYGAGGTATGDNNTLIGSGANASAAVTNSSALGKLAVATASNQVSLGANGDMTLLLGGTQIMSTVSGVVTSAATISGATRLSALTTNGWVTTTSANGTLSVVAAPVTSLAGTSNQITASGSTGAVTLSLPAALSGITSIATTTGPFVLQITDTSSGYARVWGNATYGSSELYIDASNIGGAPAGAANLFIMRSATNKGAAIQYATGSTVKWRAGMRSTSDDHYYIFDNANSIDLFKITEGTISAAFVSVLPTTASTSTTTGSLVNSGGFGNAGAAWIGGLINVAGASTLQGTVTTSTINGPSTTDLTLAGGSSGASLTLQSTGSGIAIFSTIQKVLPASGPAAIQIYGPNVAGGNAYIDISALGVSAWSLINRHASSNLVINSGSAGGGTDYLTISNSTGAVALASTTASTTPTTGALQVAGGAGIAGAVYAGGGITSTGSSNTSIFLNTTSGSNKTSYIQYQSGGSTEWYVGSDLAAGNVREYGIYRAGNGYAMRVQDGSYTSTPVINVLPTVVSIGATTASTSTTTGALVVSGGVGVAGNQFNGGNLNVDSGIAKFGTNGTSTLAAWGSLSGQGFTSRFNGTTYNDASATGTVAIASPNVFATFTLQAGAATTVTDAANIYIAGEFNNGGNVTASNSWGFWNTRKTRLDGGIYFAPSTANPTVTMQFGSTLGQGQLSIQNGATVIGEFHGTSAGLTMHYPLKTDDSTASTSTTTGCAVFSGGLGVAGAQYVGGGLKITAGNLGIGADFATDRVIAIGGSITSGSADQFGLVNLQTFSSAATSSGTAAYLRVATAAAAYTMTSGTALELVTPNVGAASAITTARGLHVQSQGISGVTNAYGIDIEAQSGAATTNVGLRNAGTTQLTGLVGVGAAPSAAQAFTVTNNLLTGTTQNGIVSNSAFTSAATAAGLNTFITFATANSAFTMGLGYGIYMGTPSVGAASAVTTLTGLKIENQGASNVTNAIALDIAAQSGAVTLNVGLRNAGTTLLTNATASTLTTNGCAVLSGGMGVAGAINLGTYLSAGTAALLTGTGDIAGSGWMQTGAPTGGSAAKHKIGALVTGLTLSALLADGIEYEAADGTKLYLLVATRP